MNTDFFKIIAADAEDRIDLFLTAANRLGTSIQNIEKDFWVSWILDLLFNGRHDDEPRLLFKGGTSLSKAYALISRFSEDIDITVFREDVGQDINISDLQELSGKQQRKHLEAIKIACQEYINGPLKNRLNQQIKTAFRELGISSQNKFPIEQDPNDPDKQTLLFNYPTVSILSDTYVQQTVKIEAGAKSALDPHRFTEVKPYVSNDMLDLNLIVPNIITIDAERTFWDKVVILHGQRRWYDNRGTLRHEGHRVSRHYYDIYKLIHSPILEKALKDLSLAQDCAQHAQICFNSGDLDLKNAVPGSLVLTPSQKMIDVLNRDYKAMSGMIFGEIPEFSDVLHAISNLEHEINQGSLCIGRPLQIPSKV